MPGPSKPCVTCGQPCPAHPSRGRPRKWCSEACKPSRRYVPPSRADHCSDCGKEVQRSWTSADTIVCLICRRKRTPRKVDAAPRDYGQAECPICHVVFDRHQVRQVYCSAMCRESRRNWPKIKVASAAERGYGIEHQRERAKWKPLVDAGQVDCCLCGDWIEPGTKWHLDHNDERTGYRGAAHALCNVRAGARRGNKAMPRPQVEKLCECCGHSFSTIYPRQRFCSIACRRRRSAA